MKKVFKNKIIFLDIDGPMIPSGSYIKNPFASFQRDMASMAVDCMNYLCDTADAKIVTNSSHNYHDRPADLSNNSMGSDTYNLREDLIFNGIEERFIHKTWRTTYRAGNRESRLQAIHKWIRDHTNHDTIDWIVFDDVIPSTFCPNAIDIDFDVGITVRELNKALDAFNERMFIIL